LFDAFASKEKTLHAHSGRHYPVPEYERDSSARFFAATSAGPPTRLRTDVKRYLRPAPRRTQIPPLPRSCRPGSARAVHARDTRGRWHCRRLIEWRPRECLSSGLCNPTIASPRNTLSESRCPPPYAMVAQMGNPPTPRKFPWFGTTITTYSPAFELTTPFGRLYVRVVVRLQSVPERTQPAIRNVDTGPLHTRSPRSRSSRRRWRRGLDRHARQDRSGVDRDRISPRQAALRCFPPLPSQAFSPPLLP